MEVPESKELEKAYRVRYNLRKPYKQAKSLEIGVPWLVVEREARLQNMTVEEFIVRFEVECLFNAFEGLHYRFVQKEDKEDPVK